MTAVGALQDPVFGSAAGLQQAAAAYNAAPAPAGAALHRGIVSFIAALTVASARTALVKQASMALSSLQDHVP